MRYVYLVGVVMALAACARADGAVQTAPSAAAPLATDPVVTTDVGSFSFRGLRVAVGETSPSHDIVIRSTGAIPLTQLTATVHGDFTVTKMTCPATLASTPSDQAHCSVSVAFRPTQAGSRSGDLTIGAAGVKPSVVALDGGTPVEFPTLQQGSTAVQWVELPSGTVAVSGSVTGPFAIALQPSYTYGSISGVSFAADASTNGTCVNLGTATCSVFLGIEQLATAPLGQSTGTVTLSNGQVYAISANALATGVLVSAANVSAGSIPVGSTGDINPITITNRQSAALILGQEQITGPFGAANHCPTSLAAGASCSVDVYFSPQATGAAAGYLSFPTGASGIVIALEGTGIADPADVTLSPANLLFDLGPSGNSAARTIVISNGSATKSVQVGALTNLDACNGNNSHGYCLHVLSNNCSVLAPRASCLIDVVYEGSLGQGALPSYFNIPLTASGSGQVNYALQYTEESPQSQPGQSAALSVTPSTLQFPPTPFGHASAPQSITVKNISTTTVTVARSVSQAQDFMAEPSCGPLVPGAACNFSVRFFPTSGNTLANDTIWFTAVSFDSTNQIVIGEAGVPVSGFSISPAAVASPAYPPLVQPVDSTAQGLLVTNTSSTPLIVSSVGGNNVTIDASNCVAPLAPGQSCSLIPHAAGLCPFFGCAVIVYSNAASSPDTYAITGAPGDSILLTEQFTAPSVPSVFAPTAVGTTATMSLPIKLLIYDYSTPLAISLAITSDLDRSLTTSNNCPSIFQPTGVIPFGESCQISVTFTPSSLGFFSGTVTITSNAGKWTVPIGGYGVSAPVLSISPASLLLSAVVGQTDKKTVTLKNTSTSALPLAVPVLAGPQAASFSIGSTCGSSLAAAASCTIDVTYTKPDYESFAALIITSGNNVIQTVPLTGVLPELFVGYQSNDLPPTYVGASVDGVFTLSSFLGAPITIESIGLSGFNVSSFKIASSTCVPNVTLTGTKTCVIDIAFMPQAPGPLSTNLTIISTAGTRALSLESAGLTGPAKVSPTALAFANETLGTTSAAQRITISNPNPSALTLPALPPVSGANAADFKVAGACTTIAANASCQLLVSFSPSAAGARSAALVIGTGTTYDPFTGMTVVHSTTVQFTGAGIVTPVPNVVGDTQSAATSAIIGADLVLGIVTHQTSMTIIPGLVLSQTPTAGVMAARGSAVNLIVSTGSTCSDLQLVKAAFGSKRGQPAYNPSADVNNDGVVNIIDLSSVARALPAGAACR